MTILNDDSLSIYEKQIHKYVEEQRPPEHIRPKLDIGYQIEKQALIIFEIRPRWDDESQILHLPFVKTKYIKSKDIWNVYWMRASGKWVPYGPKKQVKRLSAFFKLLDEDAYGAFKG